MQNELSRGSELADNRLLAQLRLKGFTIDQSAEIETYLNSRNANAATFLEKDLLLRADARKIEVLEEYLHNVQRQVGRTNRLDPWALELHVKDFMIRHWTILGISDADVRWLENWLDAADKGGLA